MVAKFPYSDPMLINVQLADITKRETIKFDSINYFAKKFTCLTSDKLDKLEDEFMHYQVEDFANEITSCTRVDKQ